MGLNFCVRRKEWSGEKPEGFRKDPNTVKKTRLSVSDSLVFFFFSENYTQLMVVSTTGRFLVLLYRKDLMDWVT